MMYEVLVFFQDTQHHCTYSYVYTAVVVRVRYCTTAGVPCLLLYSSSIRNVGALPPSSRTQPARQRAHEVFGDFTAVPRTYQYYTAAVAALMLPLLVLRYYCTDFFCCLSYWYNLLYRGEGLRSIRQIVALALSAVPFGVAGTK